MKEFAYSLKFIEYSSSLNISNLSFHKQKVVSDYTILRGQLLLWKSYNRNAWDFCEWDFPIDTVFNLI